MLNKNTIQSGITMGLILPILAVLIFEVIMHPIWVIANRGLPYFIVVALNLGVLRYFAGKHQEKTVQGIMLITFAFLIVVYFFRFR
jgi:hypothetical protein